MMRIVLIWLPPLLPLTLLPVTCSALLALAVVRTYLAHTGRLVPFIQVDDVHMHML